MDTTCIESDHINYFLARVAIEADRANQDPKKVLIRAFVGSHTGGENGTPLYIAYTTVAKHYRESRGVEIFLEEFTNDLVKYTYHWTCTELFNHLLASDIHILSTHLHQGMLRQGGLGTWNMVNILMNLRRLKPHLGVPSGVFTDCPVASQDKMGYYEALEPLGLCAPTLQIDISHGVLVVDDLLRLKSFINEVNKSPLYRNDNKFCAKLPFTTNSKHGKTAKYGVGFEGIVEKILQYLNSDEIYGYIPYCIVQPEIPENCEAKIVCFNGKAICRNPNKPSKGGRSPFGNVSDKELFDFAEHVISVVRRVCPQLITNQVLRIDIFGFRHHPGKFIVNEIEGYEAQRVGRGVYAGSLTSFLQVEVEKYWEGMLRELIDYHLEHNTNTK